MNLSKDSVMYLKRVFWMRLANWRSDRKAVQKFEFECRQEFEF